MDSSTGDGAAPTPENGGGAGPTRAGRRSNGLTAAAYGVLAQCEPQIADALLGALAQEGIAAYAAPYEGSVGGYLEVHPPVRPLVRVWVDSAEVTAARRLFVDRFASTAEPPAVAADAAWQEIVASLRRSGPDGPTPWPDAENLGPRRTPSEPAEPPTRTGGVASIDPAAAPVLRERSDVPGSAEDLDEELADSEHFVPPPPPPVPVPTGPSAYGIAALVAGSLVLLVSTMTDDQVSPALLVLAIAAIVGGFATLVMRMREGPPTDSDPDDGAVL